MDSGLLRTREDPPTGWPPKSPPRGTSGSIVGGSSRVLNNPESIVYFWVYSGGEGRDVESRENGAWSQEQVSGKAE
jgi:hypothetical protein